MVKASDQIMAKHRLPPAKEQLKQQWNAWIAQDAFKSLREAATRAQATAEILDSGPENDALQLAAFMACYSSST